jgi:t-SNARE complex subunit (syntaxin)
MESSIVIIGCNHTVGQLASMHHHVWRSVSTREGANITQVLDIFVEDYEPFTIYNLQIQTELTLFIYQNKSAQDAPKHYQPWKAHTFEMSRKEMQ